MNELGIHDKETLLKTLADTHQCVAEWFTAIQTRDFFKRQPEVWSASDNLDHLIRSVKPVAKAMNLPKLSLQGLFGRAKTASRSYREICEFYRIELAKGAAASGRYLPGQAEPGEKAEAQKMHLLEQWTKASSDLVKAILEWSEADLDTCQLPHPILGKLTVREMLFFTIYHNRRHASQAGD